MTYNWHQHWEKNELAFHLKIVNPQLDKYWHSLGLAKGNNVLVPLCGKSLDMLWMVKQGFNIIGVELSPIACEDFFKENALEYKVERNNNFLCFYRDNIRLYCGDLFALEKSMLPPIHAVYDRAALIALPPELRKRYVPHVLSLLKSESKILLITFDSPDPIHGPPFPVSFAEVTELYGACGEIKELTRDKWTEVSEHLANKGYQTLFESVYLIHNEN